MKRIDTRKIMVGNVQIGGQNRVIIQSMCNTKTKDVKSTVNQILELEKAGCEIIRVAALDLEDAKAIKEIKKQIHIPIVADIHFDYKIALEAINAGVDKVRINPGNIGSEDKVKAVKGIEIESVSDWIETEPYGYLDQPNFLNGCACLRTWLEPFALLDVLQSIEAKAGRERKIHWGPRIIWICTWTSTP